MKNLITILLACLMLTGCLYQSVSLSDINAAKQICTKHNSEIDSITVIFDGRENVICTNRNTYRIDNDILK
jgi:uncharacterized lipoprotein YajG